MQMHKVSRSEGGLALFRGMGDVGFHFVFKMEKDGQMHLVVSL
jgi:hypothetical protein